MSNRFWIVLFLSAALCVSSIPATAQSGGFPNLGHIGPSTGEVVGILVGAGVAIGVVVYLVIPKHKTIEGCVLTSDGGLRLNNGKDKQEYALGMDNSAVRSGRRFRLKGKQGNKKSGIRDFRVTKVIKDEGPCGDQPAALAPGS
jgi:hypothetical protein